MRALSLFDRHHTMAAALRDHGFDTWALDINRPKEPTVPYLHMDFFDFDYRSIRPGAIQFIFAALPCTAWSKASGKFHFNGFVPGSKTAIESINMIIRLKQVLEHFNCPFIVENPSGGLANYPFVKMLPRHNVYKTTLDIFGFPTQKPTDLFCSPDILLITNKSKRVWKKYQKTNFDNLSYSARVKYPDSFADWLAYSVACSLGLSSTSRTQIC